MPHPGEKDTVTKKRQEESFWSAVLHKRSRRVRMLGKVAQPQETDPGCMGIKSETLSHPVPRLLAEVLIQ